MRTGSIAGQYKRDWSTFYVSLPTRAEPKILNNLFLVLLLLAKSWKHYWNQAFDSDSLTLIDTMSNPSPVAVFTECILYLRVINAFDAENFGHRDWRQKVDSNCYGFLAMSAVIVPPVAIMLSQWFLVESDADERKIVATVPLMLSVAECHITFIAMLVNRRILFGTIYQIQRVVDRREWTKNFDGPLAACSIWRSFICFPVLFKVINSLHAQAARIQNTRKHYTSA